MTAPAPDLRLSNMRAESRLAAALASFAVAGGALSFLGWAFDAPRLTDWFARGISIQPNAALISVCIGGAVLLQIFRRNRAAAVIAAVASAISALTVFENVAGVDLNIDRVFLFDREWGARGTTAIGRMGIPAATSFLLLGVSILLSAVRALGSYRNLGPWLPLLPLAVSSLSVLGFLYNSNELFAVPGITAISLQTAIFVFVLAIAVIAGSPTGPMEVFGRTGPAGIVTRRLLPFVFLVPVFTGVVRLAGERAGLYDTAFGVALHNLVEISLLLMLLLWTGRAIARHSDERERAEAGRRELLGRERAAREEAERQGMIREEFLATLSHELRTPLNAILGWAQVLRAGARDGNNVDQAVEVIERNARLQAQMIEDLLDVSRILSGKMRLNVQPVDLAEVVNAAADSVHPTAEAKGVRLQRVVEPVLGAVNGDPARLQQVVWNLLANAVKFTPRGGRVQVVLARVNSHVEITVGDSGEGIAPEFVPHLFERFRQADASTSRPHGGLGLGLALVKQLVELHGGKVTAASPGLGLGSTFVVHLPLAIVQAHSAEPRLHPHAPDSRPRDLPAASLQGLSILVVDDERDSLDVVAHLLRSSGGDVVAASSAAEALELALARPFDVIVSDIGMPGRDGYDLMKDCRANGVTAPAIALTAYARSEDRTKALSSGYQTHVAKPVEAAEIIATVAALIPRATRRGSQRP
jgi:signal transduction histidine kinase/ActR/RegA family two-component response regulator